MKKNNKNHVLRLNLRCTFKSMKLGQTGYQIKVTGTLLKQYDYETK